MHLTKIIEVLEEIKALLKQIITVMLPYENDDKIEPFPKLMDNTDLRQLLKVADTKFYLLKKLFTCYKVLGKDYYFESEVYAVIRSFEQTKEC